MHKIVISGPESTGKTDLSVFLAEKFSAPYIPEYAREYIEKLGRPYRYEDVEHIARMQWDQFLEYCNSGHTLLILDTFLVITRIWFLKVFDKVPSWIDPSLKLAEIDLYLLCYPDLEWQADPVRGNPGIMRMELFDLYHHEILRLGSSCEVIRGRGQERYANALTAIHAYLPHLNI